MEDQAGKIRIAQSGQRDIGCASFIAQERHFGQVGGGEIHFGIGCAIFDGQIGQRQAAELIIGMVCTGFDAQVEGLFTQGQIPGVLDIGKIRDAGQVPVALLDADSRNRSRSRQA